MDQINQLTTFASGLSLGVAGVRSCTSSVPAQGPTRCTQYNVTPTSSFGSLLPDYFRSFDLIPIGAYREMVCSHFDPHVQHFYAKLAHQLQQHVLECRVPPRRRWRVDMSRRTTCRFQPHYFVLYRSPYKFAYSTGSVTCRLTVSRFHHPWPIFALRQLPLSPRAC